MKLPIIILAGPTASGKSAYAIKLAKPINAEIINADSKQLYKEIPIITAQPSKKDKELTPHTLYGNVSVTNNFSTAKWVGMANEAIKEAFSKQRIPLFVGGSGLYIKTLIEGLSPIPEIDSDVRDDVRKLYKKLGQEEFFKKLTTKDPIITKRLHPSDTQRCIRAMEVSMQTGKSLTEWQKIAPSPTYPKERFLTLFLSPPREVVYANCNKRFKEMIAKGVVDEVKKVDELGLDESYPAMKAHGLPEIRKFLHGKMSLDEAMSSAQINTRHYIKRQFTWFRHQLSDSISIYPDQLDLVEQKISEFLLTDGTETFSL